MEQNQEQNSEPKTDQAPEVVVEEQAMMYPIPAPDFLLVVRAERNTMTQGGIALPEQSVKQPLPYGRVVAVGENCKLYALEDYVLMKPFGGFANQIGKTTWLFIKEEDIVGTLHENHPAPETLKGLI